MKFDRHQQLRLRGWSRMVVKQFQDGGRLPFFWKSIYRHISAKNHPIFMKFCTQQHILNWTNVTWSKMKKLHWTDSESPKHYVVYHKHYVVYRLPAIAVILFYWIRMKVAQQLSADLSNIRPSQCPGLLAVKHAPGLSIGDRKGRLHLFSGRNSLMTLKVSRGHNVSPCNQYHAV